MDLPNHIEAVFKDDPRPTILMNLDHALTEDVSKLLSCNKAVLAQSMLREELFQSRPASSGFLAWIQADASNNFGDAYEFCGLKWIKLTVHERWMIASSTTAFKDVLEEATVPQNFSSPEPTLPLGTGPAFVETHGQTLVNDLGVNKPTLPSRSITSPLLDSQQTVRPLYCSS